MTPTPPPAFLATPTAMFSNVNLAAATPVFSMGNTSVAGSMIQGYNAAISLGVSDFLWMILIVLMILGSTWMVTKAASDL